jgi:hypothetical protein
MGGATMSATQIPTFEELREMFRVTGEQFRETRESIAELRLAQKESEARFDRQMSKLGNRIGELVEAMVEGGIVRLFRELGYDFDMYARRGASFGNRELGISGEIDFFLENGDYACLVEVKTNLSEDDVRDHMERLEKFRKCSDIKGDKRRFIAAVGGGVVRDNVRKFALSQGIYVIQQSGENVEVIAPEGKPKLW